MKRNRLKALALSVAAVAALLGPLGSNLKLQLQVSACNLTAEYER
jgi:hypothetical protein